MKLPSIKDCDRNTRLVYTFVIDTALTIVAYLMMPGILGGYYNNFVIHSPTIWYDAPSSILAWCPILDGAFFVIMFGVIYIALWSLILDI